MDAATLSEVVEARTLDIASNMTQPAFGGLVSAIFGLKPTWSLRGGYEYRMRSLVDRGSMLRDRSKLQWQYASAAFVVKIC